MTSRSPLILILLLAATVCVDVIAVREMRGFPNETAGELFFGLVFGQLGVVCLWATFSTQTAVVQWLAPIVAAYAATTWTATALGGKVLIDAAAVYGLYVSLLMAALWLLKQTPYWRGASSPASQSVWQFSLKQLLLIMTAAAAVFMLIRNSIFVQSMWPLLALALGQSLAITLVAALAAGSDRPWAFRLAMLFGATFVPVGALALLLGTQLPLVVGLIEAIVLFVWIELAAIVPRGAACARPAATQQTTSAPGTPG